MKAIVTLVAWLAAISTPALAQTPVRLEATGGVERLHYRPAQGGVRSHGSGRGTGHRLSGSIECEV